MTLPSYKKHSTRVVLFILLLAMVGIVWYGIVPFDHAVSEKMRGIQEYYARQENREKQVARLPELKAQYDAIVQNEGLLNVLVPEDGVVDFVKTLERLASDTHVEMSITSQNNGQVMETKPVAAAKPSADAGGSADSVVKKVDIVNDAPFTRYLYLNIKARGQYEDIVIFLRKMETLPVGLDVIRVEMKKGEAQEVTPAAASGSGLNPFLLSDGTQGKTAPPAAQKDTFEAVFDVLVYMPKQN